jgi:hypothetical protein
VQGDLGGLQRGDRLENDRSKMSGTGQPWRLAYVSICER